jgi:hypothetical protein
MSRESLTLTEAEWEIVEDWYNSAAGESASGCSCPLREHVTTQKYFEKCLAQAVETKALLDKLGFKYHYGDAYSMKGIGILPAEYDEDA